MEFRDHNKLAGAHAFLSPSKYHWVNDDLPKLEERYRTAQAALRGTKLHSIAHDLITMGINLPDDGKTMSLYVNDAIGYKMKSEQVVYYSPLSFGTADTISFIRQKLRIHDLKTGTSATSVKQLFVLAAYFCLEYKINPFEIQTELRIYQNDDIAVWDGDPDEIAHIMDKTKTFVKHLMELNEEAM